MKKIFYLILIILYCSGMTFSSCRNGNSKKSTNVTSDSIRGTQSDAIIHYAKGFWLEQKKNYQILHIKDPQSQNSAEYTFALRQRGTQTNIPDNLEIIDLPVKGFICMTSLQLSNFIRLGATDKVVGISSTRFLNNPTMKQQ